MEKQKRIRIKKDVFKNAEFGKCYKTREGRLMCEITFSKVNTNEADEFNKCIEYFQDLNELGYRATMHKTSDNYVITIMW